MADHTPGPWAHSINKPGTAYDIKGDGRYVCSMSWSWHDSGAIFPAQRQSEANARLIAAAPELLAALVTVLDEYNGVIDPDRNGLQGFDQYEEVVAARAAIAKATS
jgi:hypothetical protein